MKSSEDHQYNKQLKAIHDDLGIAENYADDRGLDCYRECENLVETELDVFSRQPLMEAKAFAAWRKMKASAGAEGVELGIISVYRSVDYQKNLIQNKLVKGHSINDILKVNAVPGYSEHHSGQAVDIACSGYEHLSEEFEQSPAFAWLCSNAEAFGFSLSFPKNNAAGFLYEPWHWKFT